MPHVALPQGAGEDIAGLGVALVTVTNAKSKAARLRERK